MPHRLPAILALILLLNATFAIARSDPASEIPRISIAALDDEYWEIEYAFRKPTQEMLFPRSPDRSRVESWVPHDGFEIVATSPGEIMRRKDGREFRTVVVRVPPVYRVLPKDYAPFSPFGDGGMLLHTGRFFACGGACPDDASWVIELRALRGTHIAVDGKRHETKAVWSDMGDGRVVYLGESRPLETRELISVIDNALPDTVREQLLTQLPAFIKYFSEELGTLTQRPMLFVSYDLSHPTGWGRQGGVLPGQIFIHFYGNHWREEMKKASFANDLAWHFAHEASHLYQRHKYAPEKRDWWIHEGAADAFAAIALRDLDANATSFIDMRVANARSKCVEQLAGHTIGDAIVNNTFDAAYTCGLIVNLAIHEEVRNSGSEDGLYAVWREYLRLIETRVPSSSTYVDAIASAGAKHVTERIAKLLNAKGSELVERLD